MIHKCYFKVIYNLWGIYEKWKKKENYASSSISLSCKSTMEIDLIWLMNWAIGNLIKMLVFSDTSLFLEKILSETVQHDIWTLAFKKQNNINVALTYIILTYHFNVNFNKSYMKEKVLKWFPQPCNWIFYSIYLTYWQSNEHMKVIITLIFSFWSHYQRDIHRETWSFFLSKMWINQ